MTLPPWAQFIIGIIQANYAVVQSILVKLGLVATEATASQIFTVVDDSSVVILDIRAEEDNLQASIDAFRAEAESNALAIISAISGLPQVGDPVVLPTVPPAGYGSPALSDISDAVWNNPETNMPNTPGDTLLQVARSLNTTALFDMPLYVGIFRVSRIDWPTNGIYITSIEYPTYDPTDILSTDTLLSMLTRQNPGWGVGNDWAPQSYVSLEPGSGGQAHYTTLIDEDDFALIKAGRFPSLNESLPPVWPGSAGVVLGTPIAVDVGVTISTPMDGVLVDLTSVPARLSAYTFGTAVSYKALGGLAFVNDAGEIEPYQTLGFTSAIYTPKTMAHAAGVVFRSLFGVVGTITPWTRL